MTMYTDEDVSVSMALQGEDIDGDALTWSNSAPANGSVTILGNQVTYTPVADFNGNDSFTVTANDGTCNSVEATIAVIVQAVNDVPVAQNDRAELAEDDVVVIAVTTNDTDLETAELLVVSYTQPANGSG